MVSYLTEELVRQGHDVTLFASGDSGPWPDLCLVRHGASARSVDHDPLPYHIMMMRKGPATGARVGYPDFHVDYVHAPFVRQLSRPALRRTMAGWICRI